MYCHKHGFYNTYVDSCPMCEHDARRDKDLRNFFLVVMAVLVVWVFGAPIFEHYRPTLISWLAGDMSKEGDRLPEMRKRLVQQIENTNRLGAICLDCWHGRLEKYKNGPYVCGGLSGTCGEWHREREFSRHFILGYEERANRWNAYLASSLQIAASDPRWREYYFAHEHKTDGLPALVGG